MLFRSKQPVEERAESQAGPHTDPEYTVHTVHLSRPIVLGNEADGRPVEALDNEITVIFKVDSRRRTGYRIGPVTVDRRLYYHIRDGEDHALYAGRHPDTQHTVQFHPMDLHPVEMQPERFLLLAQQPDNQGSAHGVGYSRGHRHTGHSHLETDYKQQVEQRIDYTRRHQYIQRTPRIAHATQYGGPEIIRHDKRHPQEIDAQVNHRLVQHIGRSTHPVQYRTGRHLPQHQQEESADNRHQLHRVDGVTYAPVVMLAYVVGDNGTGTHGNTHEQIDKQPYDRRVTSYGRKGLASYKVAHYRHINRIEKFLQQTAGRQRQGKQQDFPEQRSVQHIYLIATGTFTAHIVVIHLFTFIKIAAKLRQKNITCLPEEPK